MRSALSAEELTGRLRDAAEGLALALADTQTGRLDVLTEQLEMALAIVRDASAACAADLRTHSGADDDPGQLAATRTATVALDETAENAGRMISAYAAEIAARPEVVWLDRPVSDSRPVRTRCGSRPFRSAGYSRSACSSRAPSC